VTSVSINLTKGNIITFLGVKLSEDDTPDAIDESADFLKKIHENLSEM